MSQINLQIGHKIKTKRRKIGISQANLAKKLSISAQQYDISDVRPDSFASGIILLYSKNNKLLINKKDISIISNISEVTINKCYKKIEEIMK